METFSEKVHTESNFDLFKYKFLKNKNNFPKFEALADLYFRALDARLTCIGVRFANPIFQ